MPLLITMHVIRTQIIIYKYINYNVNDMCTLQMQYTIQTQFRNRRLTQRGQKRNPKVPGVTHTRSIPKISENILGTNHSVGDSPLTLFPQMTDQKSLLNKQRAGSFSITTFLSRACSVLVEEAGAATCPNEGHAWERNLGARMECPEPSQGPGGRSGRPRGRLERSGWLQPGLLLAFSRWPVIH